MRAVVQQKHRPVRVSGALTICARPFDFNARASAAAQARDRPSLGPLGRHCHRPQTRRPAPVDGDVKAQVAALGALRKAPNVVRRGVLRLAVQPDEDVAGLGPVQRALQGEDLVAPLRRLDGDEHDRLAADVQVVDAPLRLAAGDKASQPLLDVGRVVRLRAGESPGLDADEELGAAAGEAGSVGRVAVAEAQDPASDP